MYAQTSNVLRCPNGHTDSLIQGSRFCNLCGAPLLPAFQQMPAGGQQMKPLPRRYTTKEFRWIGAGLMLGALVFLLFPAISDAAGIFGLFLFLACFVPGMMMLGGFFGEPARVARMREAAVAQGNQGRQPAFAIRPREFRYKIGWFAYSVLIILSLSFFLAGILFLAVSIVNPSVRAVLIVMGLFFLLFGVLGFWYTYRTSQLVIKVDACGMKAVTLFHTVDIAWNEVVTLEGFDCRSMAGGTFGQIYKVYSLQQTIEFTEKLEHYRELIALIDDVMERNYVQGRHP
jgi:hypothetical protein